MRGTGPYPEETFGQREERLRLEDERDSYRVKQVIEDRDEEGGMVDTIKNIEWSENQNTTWLHINLSKGTFEETTTFPAGDMRITIFFPTEADLLKGIGDLATALVKLREHNAQKES